MLETQINSINPRYIRLRLLNLCFRCHKNNNNNKVLCDKCTKFKEEKRQQKLKEEIKNK